MTKIVAGEFVRRQTYDSKYGHYEGTWQDLEELTLRHYKLGHVKDGYRDGVIIVRVPAAGFMTSIVPVESVTKINVAYERRRDHEEPVLNITSRGSKQEAKRVDIVLYNRSVIEEEEP